MAEALAQHEKSFQKQDTVFLASKRVLGKKKGTALRFYKNVGLGFKTPREAIQGNYVDKKCPFTGKSRVEWCGGVALHARGCRRVELWLRFPRVLQGVARGRARGMLLRGWAD
jgi:Ribosomal_S17 N-terminal